jgi:hypothetical protein
MSVTSLLTQSASATATTTPSTKRKRSSPDIDIDNSAEYIKIMAPQSLFNPSVHLSYTTSPKTYTMSEIGLADKGVSPIAVSEPFPLFTREAIEGMRSEVLSKPVWDGYRVHSNLAACQLRGFADK